MMESESESDASHESNESETAASTIGFNRVQKPTEMQIRRVYPPKKSCRTSTGAISRLSLSVSSLEAGSTESLQNTSESKGKTAAVNTRSSVKRGNAVSVGTTVGGGGGPVPTESTAKGKGAVTKAPAAKGDNVSTVAGVNDAIPTIVADAANNRTEESEATPSTSQTPKTTSKVVSATTSTKKNKSQPRVLQRTNNTECYEASWSEVDKQRLLNALKRFGVFDIENLMKEVPGRTEEDIRKYINIKWRGARLQLKDKLKQRKPNRKDGSYLGPVDKWLEIHDKCYPKFHHYKSNPLARAMLLIWKYEKHPCPEECGGVDFKALYEYMYYMLSGCPPKELNQPTATLLSNSLSNFAHTIRTGEWPKEMAFLKSSVKMAQPKEKNVTEQDAMDSFSFTKEQCIEKLWEDPAFNPFNIPQELLIRKMFVSAEGHVRETAEGVAAPVEGEG